MSDQLLNKRVSKYFDGEAFKGTIISVDVGGDKGEYSGKLLYHIKYDDSDEEDVSTEELQQDFMFLDESDNQTKSTMIQTVRTPVTAVRTPVTTDERQ